MPARSEAEEITPTGVRFQDEYSFFLRNTPQLCCGHRLFAKCIFVCYSYGCTLIHAHSMKGAPYERFWEVAKTAMETSTKDARNPRRRFHARALSASASA